jgi:hypothetical protein
MCASVVSRTFPQKHEPQLLKQPGFNAERLRVRGAHPVRVRER